MLATNVAKVLWSVFRPVSLNNTTRNQVTKQITRWLTNLLSPLLINLMHCEKRRASAILIRQGKLRPPANFPFLISSMAIHKNFPEKFKINFPIRDSNFFTIAALTGSIVAT